MSVRWRIIAFELVTLAFVAIMIGVMVFTLRMTSFFVERVDGVHQRFEAIATLSGVAHNYAEQVAEVLLLGDAEQNADMRAAEKQMQEALDHLVAVTRAEINGVADQDELQSELPELEENTRIAELYHRIDAAAQVAVALRPQGQFYEAMQIFRTQVEHRLADELGPMIDQALAAEQSEVTTELARVRQLQSSIIIGAGTILLLTIACGAVLGALLHRAILKPVRALSAGAEAIAGGNLSHRITEGGKDEFGALSRTFNSMAAAIEEQRAGLLAAGERLGSEVELRTRQLRDANDRLRDIDRRRAQFLADVSHELRTPLTVLRGEADVALRGRADPVEQRQSLLRIQEQAIELGQLLGDLIDFARTDAEIQRLDKAETRLDEIVSAAVQEGEVLAEPREVVISTALGDGGSRIEGDFRRLKQAVIIGLDNAVKHSPPGGRIAVETAADGAAVRLKILDEGAGIAEEDRPHVFERFFRGHAEDEGANQGLGIGLAIAKEIIERHGGTIALDNRVERGAVLEICLPLAGKDAA